MIIRARKYLNSGDASAVFIAPGALSFSLTFSSSSAAGAGQHDANGAAEHQQRRQLPHVPSGRRWRVALEERFFVAEPGMEFGPGFWGRPWQGFVVDGAQPSFLEDHGGGFRRRHWLGRWHRL
jgi:hypothetical protein